MTEEGLLIKPEHFVKLPNSQKLDIIYSSVSELHENQQKNKFTLALQSWIIGVLCGVVSYLGIIHLS